MRRPYYRRTDHDDREGKSLPEGRTCGDCAHFQRCKALMQRIPDDEVCDWSPHRFKEKPTGDAT